MDFENSKIHLNITLHLLSRSLHILKIKITQMPGFDYFTHKFRHEIFQKLY